MRTPKRVADVEIAFGPQRIESLLPPWSEIPAEFRDDRSPWCAVVGRMFFRGGIVSDWKPKEGIDKVDAVRHLRAVLVSFQPKHEHKIAGAAWLCSLWFEPLASFETEPEYRHWRTP